MDEHPSGGIIGPLEEDFFAENAKVATQNRVDLWFVVRKAAQAAHAALLGKTDGKP